MFVCFLCFSVTRLLGYGVEEMTSLSLFEFVHSLDAAQIEKACHQCELCFHPSLIFTPPPESPQHNPCEFLQQLHLHVAALTR